MPTSTRQTESFLRKSLANSFVPMGRCGLSAPWEVTNLPKIIDRKLCGGFFLGRKLGDDDGDEDNEAAKKLVRSQCLLEDDPAEEDGKD